MRAVHFDYVCLCVYVCVSVNVSVSVSECECEGELCVGVCVCVCPRDHVLHIRTSKKMMEQQESERNYRHQIRKNELYRIGLSGMPVTEFIHERLEDLVDETKAFV